MKVLFYGMEEHMNQITEDILGIKIALTEILQIINSIGQKNPQDLIIFGEPRIVTQEYAREYAINKMKMLLGWK